MEVEAVRGVEIGNLRKCEKIVSLILEIHQKSKLQRICSFKTNNSLLYDLFCLAVVTCLSTTREMCKEEILCINNLANNDETEKYYVWGAEVPQDLWTNFIHQTDT